MKMPRLKTILLIPTVLFALFYVFGVVMVMKNQKSIPALDKEPSIAKTIAIFGASGTAGDGILKAVLTSSDIEKVHVITRRVTPRMAAGVRSGKVILTLHQDYLDYSNLSEKLLEVSAVYWAIGISSIGVDEEMYRMIHVDFPMHFVEAWSHVSHKDNLLFHYISSSDISEDASAMWAREKVRAENSLFAFAENSKMKVIAYRPDYIGPTAENGHIGQELLYWFFAPVGVAQRAEQIGQAMIEVTAREQAFENGDKLSTSKIIRYSDAYDSRLH